MYPSRQTRSRSLTFCFYWPCRLSPSPGGSVCFGGHTVIPFTWAFMCWPYTHGGSLAALPEVGFLGKSCLLIVRVPQNLCLTPLPGVRSMLLFLASRYGRCSMQRHLHLVMKPSLRRARDCSSLPLRVAALPLRLSRSEVPGPRIISRGLGILSSFSHPSWVVSLVLQNLHGAPWSSYGHTKSIFLVLKALFILGPCLGWAYSMLCHIVALIPGAGVRCPFSFVPGFVAKTQDPLPPCSSVCGLHCTGPTKRETIAMGDCYILCGWPGCYLDRFAARRQRCERFLFAAGCSTKELSKTSVSFWIRMPLSRVCRLSVTERSVCVP